MSSGSLSEVYRPLRPLSPNRLQQRQRSSRGRVQRSQASRTTGRRGHDWWDATDTMHERRSLQFSGLSVVVPLHQLGNELPGILTREQLLPRLGDILEFGLYDRFSLYVQLALLDP